MSSDSSDDEELDKLREAADPQFINNSMFTDENTKTHNKQDLPPSLRPTKDPEEQFNTFHVTPEFRNHIAKHLSDMLEKNLKYKDSNHSHFKPKRRKGGIKLLRTSSQFVKLSTKPAQPLVKFKPSEETINEEELKLVAVSPEDILSKKETKHWSNRSKAPLFTYVKTKHGLILK